MATRVLILGAGFGGLELATTLSERLGEDVEATVIDRSDAFVFGYSKLDILFGRSSADAVRIPYAELDKPGVRLLREEVREIDAEARRVRTDAGEHEADFLVIALGADYDMDATPGLAEHGAEFYSMAGAEALAERVASFESGRALVGVCGAPFKCPPAPSEAALLLHDTLSERGVRGSCEITFALPLGSPVPPSPDTSEALLAAFEERGIEFVPGKRLAEVEPGLARLDDGTELAFDLLLGVPVHRAPDVVLASGLAEGGYVKVDSRTLETGAPGVFAVGDVATVGVPKAGVFAEGAAKVVADEIVARALGEPDPDGYQGQGSCYIEFGGGRVGRVDVDFLSGPKPRGTFEAPSAELVADKREFGSSRRARWFGP
jgi:sulfide:quinone oxidoreductase